MVGDDPWEYDDQYIKLVVVADSGDEIHFRVKQTTKMVKLKESFSERVGVPVNSLQFRFDGRRINDDDTPQTFGLRQDDVRLSMSGEENRSRRSPERSTRRD